MATILVVDDKYEIRSLLKQVLTLHNHVVLEAADGMEALDAVHPDTLPDVIFMDHQMPRLSGIDCARGLRTLFPSLKIILMSSSFGIDDDGYLAASKHLFTDILPKPFRIKDVVSTLAYALGDETREKTIFSEVTEKTQPR